MKIGVWKPYKEVLSVSIYKTHVCNYLLQSGHTIIDISPDFERIPDVDIIWDATCTGGKSPSYRLLQTKIPIVVTLHGAANYVLPKDLQIHQSGWRKKLLRGKHKLLWKLFAPKVAKIITVSNYAKTEIQKVFALPSEKIIPIYHGYDPHTFYYDKNQKKNIWLHVSAYQPKKNINRIIEAYASIEAANKPLLHIVSKGYHPDKTLPKGVVLSAQGCTSEELAMLYKQATLFIFPSIHETFGIPLVEAMACGCAIISANTTSCVEITAEAGICVNPYDIKELSEAMKRMMMPEVNKEFRERAISRSKNFSWQYCGELHEKVLLSAV